MGKKGDRVCIYMGMIPELVYAVLGYCPHWRYPARASWRFPALRALQIVLDDAKAEFIVTCDGAYVGKGYSPESRDR